MRKEFTQALLEFVNDRLKSSPVANYAHVLQPSLMLEKMADDESEFISTYGNKEIDCIRKDFMPDLHVPISEWAEVKHFCLTFQKTTGKLGDLTLNVISKINGCLSAKRYLYSWIIYFNC